MPASEWGGVNVALGTQIPTSDESRSALRELIPSTRVVEHPLAKPGTSIRTTMPTPAPPARAPVSGTVSPSVSARGMVPVASHNVAVQAEVACRSMVSARGAVLFRGRLKSIEVPGTPSADADPGVRSTAMDFNLTANQDRKRTP